MSSSSRKSRGRRGRRLAAQIAGAAAVVCGGGTASADAWLWDPRVEVGAVYDDNYRLTEERVNQIEVTGAALDAELGMLTETPTTRLELRPRVHSTYFPNKSSEDATDGYLTALAQKRTQRLLSRFQGQFADQSVVSSELLAANFPGIDLGQPVSGDTGRVTLRNRQRLILAEPSIAFDWTQRRHLTASLQYMDVQYDNKLFEQVGYKSYSGTGGIVFDVTQRSSLSLNLLESVYSPADGSKDTNTTGLAGIWRTSTSEVTSFYVRAGANHSTRDAEGTSPKISATSFNGGVGAEWHQQTTRWLIDLLRSTSPSGAGVVINRDELRFRVLRDFQPRFSGFLAARGIKDSGLSNSVTTIRERKYATGSTGFEWRANRQIAIDGAYDYTWQKYQGDLNAAVSNGVHLSVVYQPRRLNP